MLKPLQSPVVWVLKSGRAGENTQLEALAEELGWEYQVKQVHHRQGIPCFLLNSSLFGIDTEMSELSAPWPDLIISASAKNEPVCRWIRDHADKVVRLVHLGRPWSNIKHFDLIITTPQYRLPAKRNIQENTVPMHYSMDSARISDELRVWGAKLSDLPKPYVAVMVGGHSGPYSFDIRAAQRLVEQANQQAEALGGSLLISTSARTPGHVARYLERHISVPNYFHNWGSSDENPYYAFLGLAESIIVTGDSISMLSEACAMLKPVYIFDLGEGPVSMRQQGNFNLECLDYFFGQNFSRFELDHLRNILYRMAMWKGLKRLTRDLRLVHSRLIVQQRAVWLGEHFPDNPEKQPFQDVSRTVYRIQRLMKAQPQLSTTVSQYDQNGFYTPAFLGSD
ncbi:MAG: ELM1/GtrOC1 family putative glycosyltransferase [Methylococcales bacterium]